MNNTTRILAAVALAGAVVATASSAQADTGFEPRFSHAITDTLVPEFGSPALLRVGGAFIDGVADVAPVAAPDQYWR
ncbi:hypothetical protein [Streptomyces sp. NBC_01244]|uniref:hypothetical protein n=1 Tax=Streptomyces sp. NBC_01244 TaxID=2903797 RepID=UPI002E0F49A7|nr:hypothetical protein OG247_20515 [Streptomyces sp. NBC_01244]